MVCETFRLSVLQPTLDLRLDFEKMLDDWERVIEVVQQLPPFRISSGLSEPNRVILERFPLNE
jgi:hypothetical protein